MNLKILLLKTEKLSYFLRRVSKLFGSVMVDGKKSFQESCVLYLQGGFYVPV